MNVRSESPAFFEAVTVLQRFVCAFEDRRMLRPPLSSSLPVLRSQTDRLALDGLLFAMAQRLDRRGDVLPLTKELGLVGAVETLARCRLRDMGALTDLGPAGDRVRLTDLARERGVSADTLRRRIGKAAGISPRELRQRQRACLGIDLIRTGMKVEAAAHECGYRSASSFSTTFRRLTGKTPAAVRLMTTTEAESLKKTVLPWAARRTGAR